MIQVVLVYDGSMLRHLTIRGHGGGEYGKDVVCAGVSSCCIGALNALDNAENYDLQIQDGFVDLLAKQPSTVHDEVVLETLVTQLETIRKSYPERVKINISGKEGNK